MVADTDDAELLGVCRTLVIVFAALEADDHVNVDVLAVRVSDESLSVLYRQQEDSDTTAAPV